jgi:hypothetical protein
MTPERRRAKRCTIDSYEVHVSVIPSRKIYSVKDISKGGLAIEYSPVKGEALKSESVDIIATDYDRFYLPKVACKTVYDIQTLMQGESFRGGERRIRGLKFVELFQKQQDELDILLKRCFDRSAQSNHREGR